MQSFFLTVIVVLAIVLVAVFLLGFKIWFSKEGRFPNFHIGGNKALRDQGISCATSQDTEAQKTQNKLDLSKLIKDIDEK